MIASQQVMLSTLVLIESYFNLTHVDKCHRHIGRPIATWVVKQ